MESRIRIAVSVLSADFCRLGEQARDVEAAGGDWLHLDIMDGHFVPNLSFGPPVMRSLRNAVRLPFDVHLMIERPELSIASYAAAGADRITVHIETCPHIHRTIQQIRELGARPGVSLNPGTSLTVLDGILRDVDLVLIMSVNPGFGGQTYIPESTKRIAIVRQKLDALDSRAELQVDGGINLSTLPEVIRAGATVPVIGSAVFGDPGNVAENLARLRAVAHASAATSELV